MAGPIKVAQTIMTKDFAAIPHYPARLPHFPYAYRPLGKPPFLALGSKRSPNLFDIGRIHLGKVLDTRFVCFAASAKKGVYTFVMSRCGISKNRSAPRAIWKRFGLFSGLSGVQRQLGTIRNQPQCTAQSVYRDFFETLIDHGVMHLHHASISVQNVH
jgi:hypothetical protein